MQTAITTAIRNIPGPPERPKSSGECWFTRCGRGCRAGRPWEDAGHRVASAFIILVVVLRAAGRGRLTHQVRVSRRPIHGRQRDRFLLVSRDFTRPRYAGNLLQAWLSVLLHKPVSVWRGSTIECCLFDFPSWESHVEAVAGTEVTGMIGMDRVPLALKCSQKRCNSELRSGHQTKAAGGTQKGVPFREGEVQF